MGKLFGVLLLIGRVYIICKIVFLLFMTQLNPQEYPMEKLTWWIYFLVFDIWLQLVLPPTEERGEE